MPWNVWLSAAALIGSLVFPLAAPAQEAGDARRPAAITTENVPPVASDLLNRLRQYQEVRTAQFEGFSPDGKGILIGTRFGNSVQLHRVYEPGGRREQITFFEEPVSGQFIPQAADGAIVLSMSQGGNENFQIHLLDPRHGQSRLLTDGSSRNTLGPLRHDGQAMIVHSNRRNGRDTDIYLADCRKADSQQLLYQSSGEFWVTQDWSLDGAHLLLLRYVSINESYPAIMALADRQLRPIPRPHDGQMSFGELAFAPDGRTLYLTCDAQGEFLQLARLKLGEYQYEWLTADLPWDVDEIEVDPASGRVAFTLNDNGASRLYLLEGDQYRRIQVPLGVVTGLEFSPDGKQLGFTLARPNAPADAFSIVLENDTLVEWTYSEAGGLDPGRFVVPELVELKSFDERKISAYYYRPPGARPNFRAPVVIDIHGGPESQYRPVFSGRTQYLVTELGYAVIAPNVRGSSGYGKSFLLLDNGPLREDSVKDIGAVLDFIGRQNILEPTRVAVSGGSYGGFMVLASLAMFGERIRAGVDVVGIANFISFLENTSPYRQDLRRAEYGDERNAEMRAFFERINPTSSAEKIRSALLVVHGKNDPRVPFSEAQQIAEKVKGTGGTVWTLYADNEGHGFGKKDNRDYFQAVEMMFLKEYLKTP